MPHRLNTIAAGTASERPVLPTRSSTLPHVRSTSVPFATSVEDDTTRRRVRAEMLQWVATEVESIEKETEEAAKRNLENIRKRMRRRGSITVEPPTPIRMAEESAFPYVRKPQSRRGSVDSAVAGGWKPVETPRKAKDWERWAENKVQAKRRLDEVWRNEDNVVHETERLVNETRAQDKIRRERDARRQWEREAFHEKVTIGIHTAEMFAQLYLQERQRAAREEQERQGDPKRAQQLQDTLKAEALRQQELEREVRRIELEARRLEEELRQRERKLQQEEAAARAKAQQERTKREQSRERSSQKPKPSPDPIWHPFDIGLDSDSDYFGAEWERFAEIFKQGVSRSNSRSRYQSPALTFKDAWESYETRWAQLSKSAPHPGGNVTKAAPSRLGFADIPWPVLHQPTRANDVASLMTESSISSFILSPFHSSTGSVSSSPSLDMKTRKARLREALLRWHPDKMARILVGITAEDERANVKAGAEAVARHLNALLARES